LNFTTGTTIAVTGNLAEASGVGSTATAGSYAQSNQTDNTAIANSANGGIATSTASGNGGFALTDASGSTAVGTATATSVSANATTSATSAGATSIAFASSPNGTVSVSADGITIYQGLNSQWVA
jgi:hypothetical protein